MSAFALLLVGIAAQTQSLADQIDRALPPPTGKNGYEEYVQAVKVLATPAFMVYEGMYSNGATIGSAGEDEDPALAELRARLKAMPYLEVKREEIQRFGEALTLVRAGSLKPVYDPRGKLDPNTLFPEMGPFKQMNRLFAAEAYVRFADGDSAAGSRSLMDGLAFSYHISGGSIIASLVGVAGSSIMLRGFQNHLQSLSVHDCRDIQQIAGQLLSAPMGLQAGLEVERKANVATMSGALNSASNLRDLETLVGNNTIDGDKSAQGIDTMFKNAQPSDFAKWSQEAPDAVNGVYKALQAKLALPEAQWFGSEDDIKLLKSQHSAVVGALMDVIFPDWDQVMAAIAKQRTQLRLLALHGKVLEYKWENNKLPEKLSDAVDAASCRDPLAWREFGYARKGDGYRLWSYGTKRTGEIELLYRSQSSQATASGPP